MRAWGRGDEKVFAGGCGWSGVEKRSESSSRAVAACVLGVMARRARRMFAPAIFDVALERSSIGNPWSGGEAGGGGGVGLLTVGWARGRHLNCARSEGWSWGDEEEMACARVEVGVGVGVGAAGVCREARFVYFFV